MRFSILTVALAAATGAAPTIPQLQSRQATTASERLSLTWLGNNSSLPKILYAFLGFREIAGSTKMT